MAKKKLEKELPIFDPAKILKKNKFFEDLKKGLQEILDYQKSKIKLSSEFIELPELPSKYKSKKNQNY